MTDKANPIPESELFRSKVDKSILIILISSVLIAVPLIMNLRWLGVSYLIFILVITLSIFFNTYYRIEKNILNVKSGVLYKKQIDIHSIYKIKEIKSFISAPALSTKRLEIFYNRFDSVMVTPKEEAEMIAALLKTNPDIEVVVTTSQSNINST